MGLGRGRATTGRDIFGWTGGALMRRFPHGSTTRPVVARPGNGYGRSIRPGPDLVRSIRLLDEISLLDARSGDQRQR
jgi:hypothetical protein